MATLTLPGSLSSDAETFQRIRATSFSRFKDAFEKLYPTEETSPESKDSQPTVQELLAHKVRVRDFAYERDVSQKGAGSNFKNASEHAPPSSSRIRPQAQKRRSEDCDYLAREKARIRLS